MASSAEKGKEPRSDFEHRWYNHLDPMVRKTAWTSTEEYVFIEAHKVFGNKWAEISKVLPGR
jgi:hypothetical protein